MIYVFTVLQQVTDRLYSDLESQLFPSKYQANNSSMVIDQIIVVLNSLTQINKNAKIILLLKQKSKAIEYIDDKYQHIKPDKFIFKDDTIIFSYKLTSFKPLNKMDIYLYYLVKFIFTVQNGNQAPTTKILQLLNSLGFINDFISNQTNELCLVISQQFKDYIKQVTSDLIMAYKQEIWSPPRLALGTSTLIDQITYQFNKWFQMNLISDQDNKEIQQQLVTFKIQKTNHQNSQSINDSFADENLLDDSQSESQAATDYSSLSQKSISGKSNSKLKSKKLASTIQKQLKKFLIYINNIRSSHMNLNIVSIDLRVQLQEIMNQCMEAYSIYEQLCTLSPALYQFFEQSIQEDSNEMKKSLATLFG
eukprot:EST45154.1 hypothetical protein SS50377_14726 [Spironucleus salmonicida]